MRDLSFRLKYYINRLAKNSTDAESEVIVGHAFAEIGRLEYLIEELEYNMSIKRMQLEDSSRMIEGYKKRFEAVTDLHSRLMSYIPPAPIMVVTNEQLLNMQAKLKEEKNVN